MANKILVTSYYTSSGSVADPVRHSLHSVEINFDTPRELEIAVNEIKCNSSGPGISRRLIDYDVIILAKEDH